MVESVTEMYPNNNWPYKVAQHCNSKETTSDKNVINHFKFNDDNRVVTRKRIRLVEAKIEMPVSCGKKNQYDRQNESMAKKEKITAKILPSKVNYRLSSFKDNTKQQPENTLEGGQQQEQNNEHQSSMTRLVRMASIWNRTPLSSPSSSSSNRTPSKTMRQSFSNQLKDFISADRISGKPKLPIISLETNRLSIQFDSQSNKPFFVNSCSRKRSMISSKLNNSTSDYNSLLRRSICIV